MLTLVDIQISQHHDEDSGEEVDEAELDQDIAYRGQGNNNVSFIISLIKLQNAKRLRHKIDTNVFQITMSCLKDQDELATGDPVFCSTCEAVFNKYSLIEESKGDEEQSWICEFCDTKNKINIEAGEVPKTDKVNFMLEAKAQVEDKKMEAQPDSQEEAKGAEGTANDISVVYCIDTSGSMSERASSEKNISRLDCVKETILAQIKDMHETYPERKLGLVTFTDYISVIGDAKLNETTVSRSMIDDYDFLLKNAVACSQTQMTMPIKDTKKELEYKVAKLRASNTTAMGPGMLTAIGIAGEGKPGSQVIVCTDGLSNLGLGSLQNTDEASMAKAREFYTRIAEYAQLKGVTVHIVTIIGQECKIDAIIPVAELTGGNIQRVDPTDLKANFNEFLDKPVLATNVVLKVKLHKALEFRNEDAQNMSSNNTILSKELGNVNEDTDVTFEYKIKET